jgi:hypothetical protein
MYSKIKKGEEEEETKLYKKMNTNFFRKKTEKARRTAYVPSPTEQRNARGPIVHATGHV